MENELICHLTFPGARSLKGCQKLAGGKRSCAPRPLDDALARGVEIVRKLTSLMKVRYANEPGKLAEWMAASHIPRPSRRAKSADPPPPSPPQ
jgi:hypothetical protein